MKFKIYYASGIGGDQIDYGDSPPETGNFKNRDEAIEYAWEMACQEYDSYAGLHGIRTPEEIMDDEDVDEKEAEEVYREERENVIEYDAKLVADDNIDKVSKDIKKK